MNRTPTWDELKNRPAEAVITQTGRWSYTITIRQGLIVTAHGWLAFGSRAHAEKKARRILARWVRRAERAAAAWTVGAR